MTRPQSAFSGVNLNPIFSDEPFQCREIRLIDRLGNNEVIARIVCMTTEISQRTGVTWTQEFQRRALDREQDDDGWMWRTGGSPLEQFLNPEKHFAFALIHDESVDGILFLDNAAKASRNNSLDSLLYVNYVATAPWNRNGRPGPGRLRGVGTALIRFSSFVSLRMGCGGHLALHSLRGSDSFYRSLGFQDMGRDAAHFGMEYFELTDKAVVQAMSLV